MTYLQDVQDYSDYRAPGSPIPPEVDNNVLLNKIAQILIELKDGEMSPETGLATEATLAQIAAKVSLTKDQVVSSTRDVLQELRSSNTSLGESNRLSTQTNASLSAIKTTIQSLLDTRGLATEEQQIAFNMQLGTIGLSAQSINAVLASLNTALLSHATTQTQDFAALKASVDALNTTVSSLNSAITGSLGTQTTAVTDMKTSVDSTTNPMITTINTNLTAIKTSLGTGLSGALITKLTDLRDALDSLLSSDGDGAQTISVMLAPGGNNTVLLDLLESIRDSLEIIAVDNHQALMQKLDLILQKLDGLDAIERLLEAIRIAVSARYGSWQQISECMIETDATTQQT